jgi:hypothetical protein
LIPVLFVARGSGVNVPSMPSPLNSGSLYPETLLMGLDSGISISLDAILFPVSLYLYRCSL